MNVLGDFEVAVSASAFGMHHALGNAFAVEVSILFEQMQILECDRPALSNRHTDQASQESKSSTNFSPGSFNQHPIQVINLPVVVVRNRMTAQSGIQRLPTVAQPHGPCILSLTLHSPATASSYPEDGVPNRLQKTRRHGYHTPTIVTSKQRSDSSSICRL